MLRIWGRINSINVQKVLWAAAELELPFRRIDAGGAFGGLDAASFVAKNPNRRIPVLEDRDLIIWESHACLRYLGARYGAGRIWPEDAVARAPVDMWLDWHHTEAYPPMRDVFWQLVRTPEAEQDLDLVERQRQAVAERLAILEAQLGRTAYVAGDAFTIADIPLALLADRWFRLAIERPDLPALARWYDGLTERPGYREYCAAPLT